MMWSRPAVERCLTQRALGWRTGILDLTQGEAGTRGSAAAERAAEAAKAARILARERTGKRSTCPTAM